MSVGGGQSPFGDWAMQPGQIPYAWNNAKNIANNAFTPYTGTMSAGAPQALSTAGNAAANLINYTPQQVSAPMSGAATASPVQNVTGATVAPVPNVSAGMGMGGIDAYMNPYISNVINTSNAEIDRNRQLALNQGASDAAMSGAFGGDRHGVADSLTNEAYGRIMADNTAGLMMGGYNTAAGLMQSDYDRALQASLANQGVASSAALANAGYGQSAALANQGAALTQAGQNAGFQQQTNLANQQAGLTAGLANQNAGLDAAGQNLAATQTLGGLAMNQYGIQQNQLDLAYQEFLRQMAYPYQQQDLLIKSLGGTGDVMGGQWTPPGNIASDIFGGLAQGLGAGLMMGL